MWWVITITKYNIQSTIKIKIKGWWLDTQDEELNKDLVSGPKSWYAFFPLNWVLVPC